MVSQTTVLFESNAVARNTVSHGEICQVLERAVTRLSTVGCRVLNVQAGELVTWKTEAIYSDNQL